MLTFWLNGPKVTAYVGLLYALPQQLRICRIAHTALVAGGIGEQCVQVLHVWLPCLGKRSLDRLYLQMAGQLRHHLVDNLVVRQRFHWMNRKPPIQRKVG